MTGSSSSSTDNSGSSESASSSSSSSTSSIASAESSSSRAAAAAAATTLTAAATAAAAQLQAEPGVPSPAPVVAAAAEVEVPVRSAVVGVPVAKKEVQGRGRLTATTSSRNWRAAPVIIARFGLALLVRMIPMAPQVTATRPFLTFPTARVISMKRLGQRRARPAISSQCSPRKQMTVWWCLLARCWARNALVQYMENSSPDFGGCWEFSENEDAPTEPWTVEINRNIVLGNVKWLPCPNKDACCFHMTDAQWDKLQRLLETSSVD